MASVDITAGDVMDAAASLMNDTAKSVYTYVVQLPYLTMALQDLRKLMEENNAPVTNQRSAVINIPAGVSSLGFNATPPVTELPDDLIEIQRLWESPEGLDQWIPMTRREFLPLYLEDGTTINQFLIWAWMDNEIKLIAANADIDLKIDYVANLFTAINDEDDVIGVINADSYLQYRTAALLAQFVGENPTRALALNHEAGQAFETMSNIDNKGRQQIATRRRPFRASWKSRGRSY